MCDVLALCRYTADCVRPSFADILNSQLIYTVQLLMISNDKRRSYPDLISAATVSFADSPFRFLLFPPSRFLDPWRYCIQCVQNGEYSGGTESFVGISRRALLNTEMERNEPEWGGMDRNEPEWHRNEPEWTGMKTEWTGMDRNEPDWTGMTPEWTGMNRIYTGMNWNDTGISFFFL